MVFDGKKEDVRDVTWFDGPAVAGERSATLMAEFFITHKEAEYSSKMQGPDLGMMMCILSVVIAAPLHRSKLLLDDAGEFFYPLAHNGTYGLLQARRFVSARRKSEPPRSGPPAPPPSSIRVCLRARGGAATFFHTLQ